jgi:hypothetical protein
MTKVLEHAADADFSQRLKQILLATKVAAKARSSEIPARTGRGSSWVAPNWS